MEKSGSKTPKPIPAGFERVSFEAESPVGRVLVEGMMPDAEHYPATIKRLSRKVTRGTAFSKPFWSDGLGTMAKTRDHSFSMMPGVWTTIRELHNATKSPGDSLHQVQVITTQPPMQMGGETVRPTQYLVYRPDLNEVRRYTFDHLPDSPDSSVDLQAAMDLTALTGEDLTGDKERSFLYTTLAYAAGDKMGVL